MRYVLTIGFIISGMVSFAQHTKHVLFIGNSYTAVNNLPEMCSQIALSMGDTLIYDSNTPGGYTFALHSTNATTIAKINAQKWDYVVLQAQSQEPSFPPAQVATDTYPYADSLVRMIRENDTCTRILFYMTWGRKNGDAANCAFYPVVCTYEGMQSRLRQSYLEMAALNNTEVSPVGAVWHTLRANYPLIELYQADESHPSVAGTYTAACTFYEAIFHKPFVATTYTPAGLPAVDAQNIRTTAENGVMDSLNTWSIDTVTHFSTYAVLSDSAGYFHFAPTYLNNTSYTWTINGSVYNTPHVYLPAVSGFYTITLTCTRNCLISELTTTQTLTNVHKSSHDGYGGEVFPNPFTNQINWKIPFTGHLQVMNTLGVIIFDADVDNAKSLPLTNIIPGIYLLKMTNTNGFRTHVIECE